MTAVLIFLLLVAVVFIVGLWQAIEALWIIALIVGAIGLIVWGLRQARSGV